MNIHNRNEMRRRASKPRALNEKKLKEIKDKIILEERDEHREMTVNSN
jgi:hypothetical protein